MKQAMYRATVLWFNCSPFGRAIRHFWNKSGAYMETLLGSENGFPVTIRSNTFGQERARCWGYYELVNLICHTSYTLLWIGQSPFLLCYVTSSIAYDTLLFRYGQGRPPVAAWMLLWWVMHTIWTWNLAFWRRCNGRADRLEYSVGADNICGWLF